MDTGFWGLIVNYNSGRPARMGLIRNFELTNLYFYNVCVGTLMQKCLLGNLELLQFRIFILDILQLLNLTSIPLSSVSTINRIPLLILL